MDDCQDFRKGIFILGLIVSRLLLWLAELHLVKNVLFVVWSDVWVGYKICVCMSFFAIFYHHNLPNTSPGYSPMTPGSNLDYSPRTPGSPLDTGLPTLPTDIEVVVKDMYHVSKVHSHCLYASSSFIYS